MQPRALDRVRMSERRTWGTKRLWNWGYSAETMNRAWLTWKQSMRKDMWSSDIAIGNRHIMLTHQDIWNLHLQHTTLLRISPTSFKNWTPTSELLNRNVRNNLLATPLAPSVALPNVAEGTYGLELRRRWYSSITEVTRTSTICVINVTFCKNAKNNSSHQTVQHSEQESKRYRRPARRWRHISQSPEGKKETLWIFQTANRCPSPYWNVGEYREVKRKGNEEPNTLKENERERHFLHRSE